MRCGGAGARLWRSARAAVWPCVASAVLLSACAVPAPSKPAAPPATQPSAPASRPLPNVNLAGYPPAFKEGFRDGCDSFRGSYRRDANRFNKENDYTIGWQDGYSICRRQGK